MGEREGGRPDGTERGVGDALRSAIEQTLRVTAGPAAATRERAGELLDEIARRGQAARDEVERRLKRDPKPRAED
jgi:hypothetical protein